MNRTNRTPSFSASIVALLVTAGHAQGPQRGRGGAQPAGGPAFPPLMCQYPLVAKYKGTGSTDDAANFVCSAGF